MEKKDCFLNSFLVVLNCKYIFYNIYLFVIVNISILPLYIVVSPNEKMIGLEIAVRTNYLYIKVEF